ncbi:MAG: ArsR family transcriptional regulator [Anaerolineaceae bacterium]|nr:ArsR family transcriptional regulator [Anaerolineaceae bacterium]
MAGETSTRILDYFSKYYSASALELSQAFGLTKPDIQYHIKILLNDRLIEKIHPDPDEHTGRGRPTIQYRFAQELFPNNLHTLLKAVIKVGLSSFKTPQEIEEYINMIAVELVGKYRTTGSLTQSLSQTIPFLNQQNYQAHWEAHQDGPKIIFRNCPYIKLIDDYPELCLVDASILELILKGKVLKTRHIQDDDLPPSCIFVIRNT